MTDGVDALLPVLKLQLLLLFGEQAGVDPRVVGELPALDDTLEPGLEQRHAHPIAGSLAWRGVRIQLAAVAQGDGEDTAVPMRPRPNVDSRASSPKRLDPSRSSAAVPDQMIVVSGSSDRVYTRA